MLVAGLTLSAAATAQTWGGFYIDGAIGARSSTTKTTLTETDSFPVAGGTYTYTDTSKNDFGKTNFLGEFSAGWRWDGPVVIGLGAFVDAASNDAGKDTFSESETFSGSAIFPGFASSSYSESLKMKQKSRYGISLDIAPNWRTHPYAKVTYAWSKYSASYSESTVSTPADPGDCSGSVSGSQTLKGWGIGGGVRHLQTNNLYFFAEVMWQDYGSDTKKNVGGVCLAPGDTSVRNFKVDPTNVIGVVGMGFKF